MHIVLIEPEIPQNTGNIVRTCALTGTVLHLVKPLGFSLEDRFLKRAGLDYWEQAEVRVWDSFEDFILHYSGHTLFLASSKAAKNYDQVKYSATSVLVFGCETRGLPETLRAAYPEQCIRIPMVDFGRSLNLANAVAVLLYEALKQNHFPGLT